MNDDELADIFRRGLNAHADDMTDTPGRADSAHEGVRRRRRLQGVIAGAAAVIVLGPVAVVAAVNSNHQGTPVAVDHPGGWRPESYNGIQLMVPPSWGWGGVPVRSPGGAGLTQCGAGAAALPSAPTVGGVYKPYVGRPVMVSDSCFTPPVASATHVWFDSPLAVGSGSDGVTVHVKGRTSFNITVADPNVAQRSRILASIHPVTTDANGCTVKWPPEDFGQHPLDPDSVTSVSVCLYYTDPHATPQQQITDRADYLFYSTRVVVDAPGVIKAINAGGPGNQVESGNLCTGSSPSGVDLVAHAGDSSYSYVVDPNACPGQSVGYDGSPDFHLLTKESVGLWAIDGAVLYAEGGSVGNRLTPYLPN